MNTKHIIVRATLIAALGTVSTSAFAVGLGGGLGAAANSSLSAGGLSHSMGVGTRMNAGVDADVRGTVDSVQSHSVRAAHRAEAVGSSAAERTRNRLPRGAAVNGSAGAASATKLDDSLESSATAASAVDATAN